MKVSPKGAKTCNHSQGSPPGEERATGGNWFVRSTRGIEAFRKSRDLPGGTLLGVHFVGVAKPVGMA